MDGTGLWISAMLIFANLCTTLKNVEDMRMLTFAEYFENIFRHTLRGFGGHLDNISVRHKADAQRG